MLHTHNSRTHIKNLLALTLAVGLTSWLMLPLFTGPRDAGATAHSSALAAGPSVSLSTAPDEVIRARVQKAYGQLPLSFEANQGQTDAQVKFLARGSGYSLFLTPSEAVLSLKGLESGVRMQESQAQTPDSRLHTSHSAVVRMRLVGANPEAQVAGLEKLAGKSNYFIGNDPEKWRTNVAHYGKVKDAAVYPGVDVVYYGKGRQLEYDFVVAAGADPRRIKLSFVGAEQVRIDEGGDSVVRVAGGELRQPKPLVYQEISGVRQEIASHYVLRQTPVSGQGTGVRGQGAAPFQDDAPTPDTRHPAPAEVGIEVGSYDASRELVIDPELDYSTYLGGSVFEEGNGIAVDGKGNAYVTGETRSLDFPITPDAFQPAFAGGRDAFVTKLSRDGEELVYSTYLGGSDTDEGFGIAVDGKGNAYVTGETRSLDFPITPDAFQPAFAGDLDAFVTKLSRDGEELDYSTYLGGSVFDRGAGIVVDGKGNAYVTGRTNSPNFPTEHAFQGTNAGGNSDAFVTKLSRNGRELDYSTYLGGSDFDLGNGIAVDGKGYAYVTGESDSPNFPTEDAFQTMNLGDRDAFVTKLSRDGEELVYSTYLGGSDLDAGDGIAVDGKGNAYVTGRTESPNFPTEDAFQTINLGDSDAFVTKLSRNGEELDYSTYLGGSGFEEGNGIAVDGKGNAYVTGRTDSPNFPPEDAFQSALAGPADAFVTKLSRDGKELDYSTYLGGSSQDFGNGIAVDGKGNAYVTGQTSSSDFPTTPDAYDTTNNGDDAFVAKIKEDAPKKGKKKK